MQAYFTGTYKWSILTRLCTFCGTLEQHAVDELLQLAVKGGDIDGQVLAYLELAQVQYVPRHSHSFVIFKWLIPSRILEMIHLSSLPCVFLCSSTMPSSYQLGVSITSAQIIIASAASFPRTWRPCLQVWALGPSWPMIIYLSMQFTLLVKLKQTLLFSGS